MTDNNVAALMKQAAEMFEMGTSPGTGALLRRGAERIEALEREVDNLKVFILGVSINCKRVADDPKIVKG